MTGDERNGAPNGTPNGVPSGAPWAAPEPWALPGRRLVPGLATAHPLLLTMPALYHDDSLARRLLAALDEVLAPVMGTLDSMPAYLDPRLAPEDFVDWLATWVGLVQAVDVPLPRRRELIAHAAELLRWQGTARGLREAVALLTGCDAKVEESGGGVSWSRTAGGSAGNEQVAVLVRVRPVPGGPVPTEAGVRAVVDVMRPAHIPVHVEIVVAPPAEEGEEPA